MILRQFSPKYCIISCSRKNGTLETLGAVTEIASRMKKPLDFLFISVKEGEITQGVHQSINHSHQESQSVILNSELK